VISEEAIAARARRAGLALPPGAVAALAFHAREVLTANPRLHLTAITEPAAFLERHVGESLEGAALLPEDARGVLLDLGSGNGYPGVPLGLARPGLRVVLAEASERKSRFLAEVTRGLPGSFSVLGAQVQRAEDLAGVGMDSLACIASRAMGNWARVLPRLLKSLEPGGHVLLWAGPEAEAVLGRAAWRPVRLLSRHTLAGRDRSWIWLLRRPADEAVGEHRSD
jgi:16S rRNA (guanine527-N7)-methyltransferase